MPPKYFSFRFLSPFARLLLLLTLYQVSLIANEFHPYLILSSSMLFFVITLHQKKPRRVVLLEVRQIEGGFTIDNLIILLEVLRKGKTSTIKLDSIKIEIVSHRGLSWRLPSHGRCMGLPPLQQSLELLSYPKFYPRFFTRIRTT